MPRTYKRKDPNRCVVTHNQFNAAKLLISQGISKRKAAAQVGIKESTLRKRLKSGTTAASLGRFSATFADDQENEIFNYIKRCDDLYYGLNMTTLRTLIYEYAEVNNIPHRFNKNSKMAGRDWVYSFLKRHPELKLRQPTQTSIARAMGFNQVQVNIFYDNLQSLFDKYKFLPSRIFNMDESGINTVPKKIPKVISMKGKKLVGKIVSAERGQTITLVCAMSVTGSYVPPVFIFPRKKMKDYLLNNAPVGSIGLVSDSGFINTDLFIEYLRHFKKNVQPTKDNPVLLILDNHSSHLSLVAVNYCRDNGIHLLTLPPHSSHKMQPLDRGFFGPLKIKFAYECDKWLSHNPGRVIGQTEVAHLVNEAFQKVATVNNAAAGFKISGIWPIDRNVFSEEDFAAASVTDIKVASTSSVPESGLLQNIAASTSSTHWAPEPLPSTSYVLFASEPIPSTSYASSSETPASELATKTHSRSSTPSVSIHSSTVTDLILTAEATSASPMAKDLNSNKYTPLSSIQPYPKAMMQNRRRKGKKSIIATDNPFKLELETKNQEEMEKIAKKKRRLELKKERDCTTKVTKNTKKTIKDKTAKIKANVNKIESEENNYYCALCGEIYVEPITEDWIQCSSCNNWWHEECTSYKNGIFICDICTND